MKSQDTVNELMLRFNCPSTKEAIQEKLLKKYANADNLLCSVRKT